MAIKFGRDPLAVEQNSYATNIVNANIVYKLNSWPKNPLDNFIFKNCLFGATNIFKNSNKSKCWWVYSGYGIAFDVKGELSFGNGFARNAVIFGADNNSSSHSDKLFNNFLILGEVPTSEGPTINDSFFSPEKNFSINFSKANTIFD